MDWGDAPAWVAILISVLVGLWTWWSDRKRRQDRAGFASVEESLQRIAESMSEQTAGAPPAVDFAIEYRSGSTYALRNVGTLTATGVTIDPASLQIARRLPDGITLKPMQSHEFLAIGAWGAPVPGEVTVSCNEWPQPRQLPMPPRR